MNSDIQPMKNNTFKQENLKKGQIYKRKNIDDLQVIRGITGKLNQSVEQKPNSSLASSATKSNSDKNQIRKLVDSKQVSGPIYQSDKRTSLLDTYARIAAMNNRRCPKRLRELAKPKRQARQIDYSANIDPNRHEAIKTYMTEIRHSLKQSKKK